MGTSIIRAMLLASVSVTAAIGVAPVAAQAQEQSYDIDIPAQSLGDAIRALGRSTRQTIVFDGSTVRGKRSVAVRGRMTPAEALDRMLAGSNLVMAKSSSGSLTVRLGNGQGGAELASSNGDEDLGQDQRGISEILVVGSRSQNVDIRRTEDDAQPYVVFDTQDLEKSGATNVEDFLRTRLPMNAQAGGELQNAVSSDGAYVGQFNLRGLGGNQTLILVDGRRIAGVAANGTIQQGNIRGIPTSQIERIEILPSTAGGIYGGGATGGVINVILKRNYNGIDVDLQYGNAFDTDVGSITASLSGGFTMNGGRTRAQVSLGYTRQNELLARDRDFYGRGSTLARTNDPTFTDFSPGLVCSATAFGTNGICNQNGLILDNGTPLGSPITYVPAGYAGPLSDSAAALVANAGKLSPFPTASLLRAPETASASFNLKHELSRRVEAFVDFYYDQTKSDFHSLAFQTLVLRGAAANNPFQQDIRVILPLPRLDLPERAKLQNIRVNGGLIFHMPGSWSASLEYGWSQSQSKGLRKFISSPTATGLPILQQAALTDPAAYPIPDIDTLLTYGSSAYSQIRSRSSIISMRFGGPLVAFPAGQVMVSGLLEKRAQTLSPYKVSSLQTPTTGSYLYQPRGTQDVNSGYVELRVPVFSASNAITMFRKLELVGSVRYDEYKSRFSPSSSSLNPQGPFPENYTTGKLHSTNYTAGLSYSPVRDIMFRASYNTGFLVPDLNRLSEVLTTSPASNYPYVDPRRGGQSLIGDPTSTPPGVLIQSVSGNPNLQPEKSRSFSYGIVLTPQFLKGFRLTADITEIWKRGEIFAPPPQYVLNNEGSLPGRVTRGLNLPGDPAGWAGPVTFLDVSVANLAKSKVRAVDIKLDYDFRTRPFGDWHLYAVATHQSEFVRQTIPSDPAYNYVGHSDGPLEWRGNAGIDWNLDRWSAGWNMQYYDSYSLCPTTIAAAGTCGSFIFVRRQGADKVPSQIYNDLYVRYRFGDGDSGSKSVLAETEITAGIQNIFDKKPPILALTPYYSTYGDPRLRRFTIALRKHF